MKAVIPKVKCHGPIDWDRDRAATRDTRLSNFNKHFIQSNKLDLCRKFKKLLYTNFDMQKLLLRRIRGKDNIHFMSTHSQNTALATPSPNILKGLETGLHTKMRTINIHQGLLLSAPPRSSKESCTEDQL